MSKQIELWFERLPTQFQVAEALERFGTLHSIGNGRCRLVEGDEDIADGVPFDLDGDAAPPPAISTLRPSLRCVLRASAVLSGSRGFWMAQVAASLFRDLGGVLYLPDSNEAFSSVESFEATWPDFHPMHAGHSKHGH